MKSLSEREIIQKIKSGEINYFEHFVKSYSKILFHFITKKIPDRHDASDILQNSFIKAYKSIHKLNEHKAFYPYLFTIVKNEMNDYFRKKKYNVQITDDAIGYEQAFISEEKEVAVLLENVKQEHKKVINLYYLEGFSYNEIAKKLDKPVNTVKTLLRRAKLAVKKNYEKAET